MTEEEIKEILKARREQRQEKYDKILQTLKDRTAKEGENAQSPLEEKDLQLIAA